jgi:hypothetical protein
LFIKKFTDTKTSFNLALVFLFLALSNSKNSFKIKIPQCFETIAEHFKGTFCGAGCAVVIGRGSVFLICFACLTLWAQNAILRYPFGTYPSYLG